MKLEEFIQSCQKRGLVLTKEQINQYLSYAALLKEWNEKMNLTAIVELEDVLDKHFYDSLIPAFSTELKGSLCDVGSGAGFPSIPMKIAFPDLEVTIVEPLGKRIQFLNEVITTLDLKGIQCVNERAEDYVKLYRESFDIVTARAVANLPMLSELCIPLIKVGGIFLAMKGPQGYTEHKKALRALTTLGVELEKQEEYTLSDGALRVNLFYRKKKESPKKYPRMFAKIKKNPL